jgi:hypothetical protein
VVRGVDWFVFATGSFRIHEIRVYTAAPIQCGLARQELQDFDYAAHSYPTARITPGPLDRLKGAARLVSARNSK